MADLQRVVADLQGLSVLEAQELTKLLEGEWEVPGLELEVDRVTAAEAEPWVVAEFVALQRDAVRLTASLDETLAYVSARCTAIMAPS